MTIALADDWMFLIFPGIRAALFRYGSMREVTFRPHPLNRSMIVTYHLITGESRDVEIPWQLFMDDRYDEILSRLTHHLGQLS